MTPYVLTVVYQNKNRFDYPGAGNIVLWSVSLSPRNPNSIDVNLLTPYTVKELLGHSTIQLTERYSHLRPDGLKRAAQMFDEKVIKNNIVPLEKTENG
jgi:hypothetical protein